MIDLQMVKRGIVSYAHECVIPHLPANQQFIAGVVLGLASSKADRIFDRIKDNAALKMLNIIEGRNVDVESIYAAAKKQISISGNFEVSLPMIGKMRFDEGDIDSLYRSIINS